jgi:hypothetical protein
VLLLGWWLLLQPPTTEDGHISEGKPLTAWEQMSVHDEARACEAAKTRNVELFGEWAADEGRPADRRARARRLVGRAVASRCVPAEHIYPPAKSRP